MKSFNILVNNGNLGRMGKTTIAYTIYKTAKDRFKYVTNDLENASINLTKFVAPEDLQHFPDGTEIDIDDKVNTIFDFGGKPDERLLAVANYVDVVIVPIAFQSISELQLTIKNINAIKEVNENIVIIVNNTDTEDSKLVGTALHGTFPDLEVFTISHSKFIRRLANHNQTVFEVAEGNRGDASQLNKKIIPQMKEILEHLKITY